MANTEIVYKFEPENIWFTSDTHFYHANIIRFNGRSFAEVKAKIEAQVEAAREASGLRTIR